MLSGLNLPAIEHRSDTLSKPKLSDKSLLKTGAYIDGKWVNADDGSVYPVENPASGEVIAEMAKCGSAETQRAIAAAEAALPAWRSRPA